MIEFTKHNLESAPESAKPVLEGAIKNMGRIPGLWSVMAESPETLQAYSQLHQHFVNTSFDAEELTVVWQTINVEHECHYCVPAHTGIAHAMNVDSALIEALRNEEQLPTPKLQALKDFTLSVVRNRGNVSESDLSDFYHAGYGQKQVLEVILGLSQKVISNYINHIAATPVDKVFEKFAWTKKA